MTRPYYSRRAGHLPGNASFKLPDLKRLFLSLYSQLDTEGYFQEYFGCECVDAGFVPGRLGNDLEAELLLALRKPRLWPIYSTIENWSEDDLFDVIEFLYDHVSKPTQRHFHDWNGCGWHCSKFDGPAGKAAFLQKINRVLQAYENGFQLSSAGEILANADTGLEPLLVAPVPKSDLENVMQRIENAVRKFRRHRSSLDDRRDAIRDLADVLEYLRPKLKTALMSKDEKDLFDIANNFGIRHHNEAQKTSYDRGIWYSWLFYYYLATIHAALRLIEKQRK